MKIDNNANNSYIQNVKAKAYAVLNDENTKREIQGAAITTVVLGTIGYLLYNRNETVLSLAINGAELSLSGYEILLTTSVVALVALMRATSGMCNH